MTAIRRASAADADALVRLRAAFAAELHGELFAAEPDDRWQASFREVVRRELASARMRILVVDGDHEADGRLAACGVGTIDQWLPGPHLRDGRIGHVSNVYTAPAYRRRGYSRAIVNGLLAWFADCRVTRIDLHASPSAEPLYRSLGFADHPDPALSRRASPETA
jgi:GNAT superfamily N-acetyltransferase